MQLKMNNLKSIIKNTGFLLAVLLGFTGYSQDVIVTDSTSIQPEEEIAQNTVAETNNSERRKVDGIAAVIGDYIILDSDVDMMYKDMQSQGMSTADVTDCQLAGSLMENKLYAHHAIQDSIIVMDAEVNSYIDQQISEMVRQVGSMDKVLEFYNKENEAEFRSELFELNKERQLANRMQQRIVENVEITPEEVRAYYESIPEDELPVFGEEVELSQIVVEPEIPESEKQKVIDRLKDFRADVLDNDASFATKAVLYSQDPGSARDGGRISLSRKDNFVKEFKDVAFSLQAGEVSEPFETEFGFHIIQVDRIRGQNIDLRHILLIPDVTNASVEEAKAKIDSIRKRVDEGVLDFAEAAREFSDEEETRGDGGKLINPRTGDTRFELSKIDPKLYDEVGDLQEGELSLRMRDQDRTGRPFFKLIKVNKRIAEHEANYATDFTKIKELALRDKQLEAIEEWQQEKIGDTYIKVNGKFKDCEYSSNWLKK
ncbi:periplasmic chaperone for outer membrane proteins SurA [Salegentibacter agarivorans]|jgi:peptidyl-prolyl cis-trans isomerase SurA|uniref:Periplasmic chaperone for outer membrane proteins SurA n=2 Tax=Flavobacteriaceae TaxID=49546 RepID=A0A1I2P916_9FLAO|nr:peptidylprolyl isomerase [Salegentibacter sp. UBA1130]SFG11980.1 periplasmic chaperone for outer membrane proteins SurA [Salegentibacter agarivorans]